MVARFNDSTPQSSAHRAEALAQLQREKSRRFEGGEVVALLYRLRENA
jgi:hypothetical protein